MENEAAVVNSQIVCPKCGHSNHAHAVRCIRCQRHLRVYCYACGAENPRASTACSSCSTLLHVKHHHCRHSCGTEPVGWSSVVVVDALLGLCGAVIIAPFLFLVFSPSESLFKGLSGLFVSRFMDPETQEVPSVIAFLAKGTALLLLALPPITLLLWLAGLNRPRITGTSQAFLATVRRIRETQKDLRTR
jgi:hypothetical protein